MKPMRSTRPIAFAAAALAVAGAFTGALARRAQDPAAPKDAQILQTGAVFEKQYVFAAGDQIEVFVRRSPEVSRTVTIRPDGYITLPVMDTIKAAGLTAPQLSAAIAKALSARLIDPEVNVIAIQTRPPMVFVVGEVVAPGAFQFRNAATAMAAVGLAGGFRKTAANRAVSIVRLAPDGRLQAIPVVAETPGQKGPYLALAATRLEADDILFVPESTRSQALRFLDDFVNKPLTGANGVISTYLNFKLISYFSK